MFWNTLLRSHAEIFIILQRLIKLALWYLDKFLERLGVFSYPYMSTYLFQVGKYSNEIIALYVPTIRTMPLF